MLAKPISISVLLHLLFVVIIITGLPSFDRLEESPMSIVEIELINNLPAITQEIIEDDSKEESASDKKKYSATPNVKPSMRSEESKNMSVLENEEPIEKTTNAKQQDDENIMEFFSTPEIKPELNKINDKLLTNLDYDENKKETDKVTALLDKFPDERDIGEMIENKPQEKNLTSDNIITAGEISNMRSQIEMCWNPPVGVRGAASQRVQVMIALNKDGTISNVEPITRDSNGSREVAIDAAVRAVLRCAPYEFPIEKYESWKEIKFTFDPRNMLGG
ncbi:MAG: cell envelope integrity protein TolA [Pseudomonadota bacterium]|nr:cell envelope integrity protein TolA [Pseudomonadota bacterium]